ncbi:hypothetical protein DSO57_1030320 [Entomophthora muscae]|uniref:Uncharacterized protein n=2 Tax=Entomophthora muscae TaxID=34485 RepID=A0ACC2UB41_9FUNG|nr:hypothetical protein DSO57_1010628 [Entomophthora muscae]KAJ9083866.1 hypothetical protein DSO57_1030320 [Entomophthora muscae]
MSSKAKLTFAASVAFCAFTVGGVHFMQMSERKSMREGPRRDDERQRQKLLNQKELEIQQVLHSELSKDQSIRPTS